MERWRGYKRSEASYSLDSTAKGSVEVQNGKDLRVGRFLPKDEAEILSQDVRNDLEDPPKLKEGQSKESSTSKDEKRERETDEPDASSCNSVQERASLLSSPPLPSLQ